MILPTGRPVRLIPAHAGKTPPTRRQTESARAHPRSRRENDEKWAASDAIQGSSPLTRGKLVDGVDRDRAAGLIPAHAGKTEEALRVLKPGGAHPRSRGENKERHGEVIAAQGSSPITRGKLHRACGLFICPGLIPAHAGKTACRIAQSCCGRDHPRSRGENESSGAMKASGPGSSPLTRGKLIVGLPIPVDARLIPAHAGKTSQSSAHRACPRVHPRSRGENAWRLSTSHGRGGSSPLTRGKRRGRRRSHLPARLIPAHAGKTEKQPSSVPCRWDHPRSRGENAPTGATQARVRGSSPLTRGKRAGGADS